MAQVCYLGDDDLTRAAGYLGGVMSHFGISYDHIASSARPGDDFTSKKYALYIISDYPASNFTSPQLNHIAERVRAGAGLLMIGGWESFHGQNGNYESTILADVLPVTMQTRDDRMNIAQPCLINKISDHEILNDLPFETPPGIGGFNRIAPKGGAQTILNSLRFSVTKEGNEFRFARGEEAPLLVVGEYGAGRIAALATDAAPHWVGGFVDWGDGRVKQAVGEGGIEVGNWYARFFCNLVKWTGKL